MKPGAIFVKSWRIKNSGSVPYDCASIAYFKMLDADGNLGFPDSHSLGLDVAGAGKRRCWIYQVNSKLGLDVVDQLPGSEVATRQAADAAPTCAAS